MQLAHFKMVAVFMEKKLKRTVTTTIRTIHFKMITVCFCYWSK